MNKQELEQMLNEMEPEERELALSADDALDRLYSYKLKKKYNVDVLCNPGGDRTKIQIDGVVMNHEEFSEWLLGKQLEKLGQKISNNVTTKDDLPEEVEIPYSEIEGEVTIKKIKKYLKDTYNHFLSGFAPDPDYEEDFGNNVIRVTNIKWGRKV